MCREEEKRGRENASPAHTRPSADNRVRPQITLLSFVVTISVLHEAQYSGSTILVHYEKEGEKRKRERQNTGPVRQRRHAHSGRCRRAEHVTFSDIIHTHVYRAEVKGL
jgi:hypothetical protein